MTQPSMSALSKQSIHTGKTSTKQDVSVGYFVLPGYAQDGGCFSGGMHRLEDCVTKLEKCDNVLIFSRPSISINSTKSLIKS